MRQEPFREDLYCRLCSDQIMAPALADQLADSPGVLRELVTYMAKRVAGAESAEFAPEVLAWIEDLGRTYAWPGNYRELEQCVKNVLIRRDYCPPRSEEPGPAEALATDIQGGRLTAEGCLRDM
jgi:DNA-binding NtrC family response regulator